MGSAVKQYLTLTVTYSLAVFYSTFAIFGMFMAFLSHCSKFFKVKKREPPACLSDDSLLGITHHYAEVNDISMHYVCAGDSSKPLMLCVHGFPEFWYSYRHQIQEFSSDYWVVSIDMRGYGDSDKPKGKENYHVDVLVEDIKQLIPKLGRSKVDVLVAHDWGGAVCWRFVGEHPELVGRYIVMNIPHPAAFVKTIYSSFQQFRMSWYIFFFQLPYLPELFCSLNDFKMFNVMLQGDKKQWKEVSDEEVEAFKYTFSKSGFTGPINYYRAVSFGDPPVSDKKKSKISVPVFMIWGTADVALSVKGAELSQKYCQEFKLQLLEDVPHFLQNSHPKLVNHYMREYLNNVTH